MDKQLCIYVRGFKVVGEYICKFAGVFISRRVCVLPWRKDGHYLKRQHYDPIKKGRLQGVFKLSRKLGLVCGANIILGY